MDDETKAVLLEVADECYLRDVFVQSTWARSHSPALAAAASLGLITTRTHEGFGRIWRVTERGLHFSNTEEL